MGFSIVSDSSTQDALVCNLDSFSSDVFSCTDGSVSGLGFIPTSDTI